MTNSHANAAESAGTGAPRAGARSRSAADRDAPAYARAPLNGITITRWNLVLSLGLAVTILGGAFMLQWDSTSRLEDEVRGLSAQIGGLRVDLHTEISGLRQEMRAEFRGLRQEMRAEFGGLREEVSGLRDEIRDLAELIRARDAPAREVPASAAQ